MDQKILSEAGVKQLSATKAFECSILRFEHISKTLQSLPAKFSLIVPPSSNSILLWLSGLTCTDENFVIKAGAARYAKEYNVVIACPDTSPRGANAPEESTSWDFGTGAGFYVDATCEGYEAYQMSSYVMSEFVPLIKQMIGLDQKIGISGHSMGGMGALQFAFRFPHVFASVSAFAPISHPSIVPWGQKCFGKYLGEENNNSGEAEESSTWKLYDPAMIIRKVGKKFEDVLVHQGSEDQFLEEQLKPDELVKACEEVGQKLTLHMAQGYDHSYYFVQTFIGEHIKYHVEAMSSS